MHANVARPRTLFLAAVAVLLAACMDVRSLSPAIGPKEAIEAPEIVARWVAGDSNEMLYFIDIERDSTRAKGYRVRLAMDSVVIDSSNRASPVRVHHDTSSGWFDAYVGRVGGRLVLERTTPDPDAHPDAVLGRAAQLYEPLFVQLYQLHPFTVTANELRVGALRADSSKALLLSGRCKAAYARDSTRDDLILT